MEHGGFGVELEDGPGGWVGRDAALRGLDFAADGSRGPVVVAFVAGVGSPVDGDLLAYAEIE